ncbi:hypothetical protein Tco_1012162 [Tanacetum coccineum]
MEEYIRVKEEKACRNGKVYNRETATYGRIKDGDEVHDLRYVKTEFLAIVFDDTFTSQEALSCEPTVSPLNDNEIDFRISLDESDDEGYTVIFDKNSFSYKIIYVNDLKTDLENDNEKFNMPSFLSPEPTISYFNDLDFLKDFEKEFPAITYNDALTERTESPQHIDEFDLKNETSLSKYDKEEQNVLYFNDLFPFNIIYPDDLKSDKDNDDNEIDIIQSSGGNVINNDTQVSNKILETSHDRINKIFNVESFIMELNVNITTWNYLNNRMLLNLIKNLYGSPPRDQRNQYLIFEVLGYTDAGIIDFKERLGRIYDRKIHRVQVFDFWGLTALMAEGLNGRMLMEHRDAQGQSVLTSRAWRMLFEIRGPLAHELILEFFSTLRFREEVLDLDTVGGLQLCHKLIACSIARRSQAPEKVTVTNLFYLRRVDVGSDNIPYLLARYLRLFASGRKHGAMISGAPGPERQQVVAAGALEVVEGAADVDEGDQAVLEPVQAPQPPETGPARTMEQRLARLEEDVHGIRGALGEQREARVRYTSYSDYHIPYVRRTRRRTDDASTSAP